MFSNAILFRPRTILHLLSSPSAFFWGGRECLTAHTSQKLRLAGAGAADRGTMVIDTHTPAFPTKFPPSIMVLMTPPSTMQAGR